MLCKEPRKIDYYIAVALRDFLLERFLVLLNKHFLCFRNTATTATTWTHPSTRKKFGNLYLQIFSLEALPSLSWIDSGSGNPCWATLACVPIPNHNELENLIYTGVSYQCFDMQSHHSAEILNKSWSQWESKKKKSLTRLHRLLVRMHKMEKSLKL